jgi:lipopolysaccharide export system protein LptC
MDRRPYFAILALAFVALATQALVWVFVPREEESTFIGPPRSDYTLTDFTLDALDEQGHHAFTMVAPRLARKEGDGSIYVTTPKYEIVDNDGSLWKGHSEAAWVNKDGTVMKLDGAVQMQREATAQVTPVEVTTRDLTITTDPKDKANPQKQRQRRLATDALTTVTDPGTVAHGVGMRADLTLKTVEFLADFHSTTQPSRLR